MTLKKRPNILIIMTDEERFPPVYENEEAKAYRVKHSKGRLAIQKHGLEFQKHYTAATACAPARATFYTGQYPSLHGVSQTPGMAKSSFDPSQFWLDPKTVPTLGHYFRAGGYRTFYKGKWHASDADLPVPGTRNALMSNGTDGKAYPERVDQYRNANRLDQFGFNGWIGPEPHGSLQANDGSVRDPGFAQQVCDLLKDLDRQACENKGSDEPWLMVSSFVNPHDIVFSGLNLYGINWFPRFQEMVDNNELPYIEPAPTHEENMETKPRAQRDYRLQYPKMYMPQPMNQEYYQFYYYLMAEVDTHIHRVYETLSGCSFFKDTIVVLTADHGDMLGAHGGMQQKWFNAYDETVHVPLTISNPRLFQKPQTTQMLTSHIDILPTLLGMADIDVDGAMKKLKVTHTEVREPVGRNLWHNITANDMDVKTDAPIYFMTDDEVETGLNQTNVITGNQYRSVIEPKHVESAITWLPGPKGPELWKYNRYFDNPRFWKSGPGNQTNNIDEPLVPDEHECYNLTQDPLELDNRVSPNSPNPLTDEERERFQQMLDQQRDAKRLVPKNLNYEQILEQAPLRD